MAIALTGTGGLFTRLGKIIFWLNTVNTARGATATTELAAIMAQYASTLGDVVDGIYVSTERYRRAQDTFQKYLAQLCKDTLVEMAYNDAKVDQTVAAAMAELIRQMTASGDDVDAPTTSCTPTIGAGDTGTGKAVGSVLGLNGIQRDYLFAETFRVECTNDAVSGTAVAGEEEFTCRGDFAISNPLSELWPVGSGTKTVVTVCSPRVNASVNLLTNSSFETFTVANTPNNWPISVGVAGTNFLSAGDPNSYKSGTYCLEFFGDAALKHSIKQLFGTNTVSTLLPNTVYDLSFWLKLTNNAATGMLRLSLQNSSGTVLTDDAGTALSTTVDIGPETTTYANHTATFITPKTLPRSTYFVIEFTTALSAHGVYLDDLGMCESTELYPSGPWLSIFDGETDFRVPDFWTVVVANDLAGDFQKAFDRIFDMRTLGLQLPHDTGGTETIADSLIS